MIWIKKELLMNICWFSCGVTSAVATKLTLAQKENVRIMYIDTMSEHEDSKRFLHDCEKWFNHPIEIYSSTKFKGHFDVIEKRRFLNSPGGAACTLELKKKVRWVVEDSVGYWETQTFGFDISESKRAQRFAEQYPETKAIFPLIEKGLSKSDCMAILLKNHVEIPLMYRLGFHNNNCVGCVKGGKGYWWKIKECFPDVFDRMAALERKIGHSCIKDCYLDELTKTDLPPIVPSCSLFCDPDFMDI